VGAPVEAHRASPGGRRPGASRYRPATTPGARGRRGEVQPGDDHLLFTTRSGTTYVYDAITASVHPWPWVASRRRLDEIYRATDEGLKRLLEGPPASPGLYEYVARWRTHAGAFRTALAGVPRAHTDSAPDGLGAPLARSHGDPSTSSPDLYSNLMLVLTDSCNLRCTYCIFSGAYPGYKPLRSQRMTWPTAKAAIDRFLALNDSPPFRALPNRKLDIAFFGGEPLLEGRLIRRIVDYAGARRTPYYDLYFSATTNLTHLPHELAVFLVEHGVGLQCSLDGPEAVHDPCRIDRSGAGSFATVRGNLDRLRRLSPEYVAEHVRSIVTLTEDSDLLAIHEFFDGGDALVPPVAFVGFLRDRSAPGRRAGATRLARQQRRLWNVYLERKRRRVPVPPGSFLYHYFEEPLRSLHERLMGPRDEARACMHTCQPGRRIAVSTDGKLHMCERINEWFPIGDVQSGIDVEQAAAVLARYRRALPDCGRCWARLLCAACCAQVCEGSEFVVSDERCRRIRHDVAQRLIALYTLLERVPEGLDCGDVLIDRHELARRPG
jgi:uncharacterized protein